MKFTTVLALFPLLSTLAFGSPIEDHSIITDYPLEGYSITEPEWELEVYPNSNETIIARGTIEQAHDEARKVNPNWDAEVLEPALEIAKRSLESESPSEFAKRASNDFNLAALDCGGRWEEVTWHDALRRTLYLHTVKGTPKNGPGPANCGRVSCAYDVAIWWCNDEPYTKWLDSFHVIADGAMVVNNGCMKRNFGEADTTSGQAFHKANWNVIVRKDSC
ncbi:uncharacterized protein BJX67DRAFT_386932 [Aspergillus lucknowensis]|uniref:Secreted protein n=1 Tax=Aspergillus lucknowensis TaxID=176173 RepID=A0ABR4M7Z0_9EURO